MYGCAKIEDEHNCVLSWLGEPHQTWQVGMFEAYVASLHWSLTQFTPSTNNVAPTNSLERCGAFRFLRCFWAGLGKHALQFFIGVSLDEWRNPTNASAFLSGLGSFKHHAADEWSS